MKDLKQTKNYFILANLFSQDLIENFVAESLEQLNQAETHILYEEYELEERGGKAKA